MDYQKKILPSNYHSANDLIHHTAEKYNLKLGSYFLTFNPDNANLCENNSIEGITNILEQLNITEYMLITESTMRLSQIKGFKESYFEGYHSHCIFNCDSEQLRCIKQMINCDYVLKQWTYHKSDERSLLTYHAKQYDSNITQHIITPLESLITLEQATTEPTEPIAEPIEQIIFGIYFYHIEKMRARKDTYQHNNFYNDT